jgi:hypothetical protein
MAQAYRTGIHLPSHIRSIIIEPYIAGGGGLLGGGGGGGAAAPIAANSGLQDPRYPDGILGVIFFNKEDPPRGIYKILTARGIFVSGSQTPHAEFKSILDRLHHLNSIMLFRARGVRPNEYNGPTAQDLYIFFYTRLLQFTARSHKKNVHFFFSSNNQSHLFIIPNITMEYIKQITKYMKKGFTINRYYARFSRYEDTAHSILFELIPGSNHDTFFSKMFVTFFNLLFTAIYAFICDRARAGGMDDSRFVQGLQKIDLLNLERRIEEFNNMTVIEIINNYRNNLYTIQNNIILHAGMNEMIQFILNCFQDYARNTLQTYPGSSLLLFQVWTRLIDTTQTEFNAEYEDGGLIYDQTAQWENVVINIEQQFGRHLSNLSVSSPLPANHVPLPANNLRMHFPSQFTHLPSTINRKITLDWGNYVFPYMYGTTIYFPPKIRSILKAERSEIGGLIMFNKNAAPNLTANVIFLETGNEAGVDLNSVLRNSYRSNSFMIFHTHPPRTQQEVDLTGIAAINLYNHYSVQDLYMFFIWELFYYNGDKHLSYLLSTPVDIHITFTNKPILKFIRNIFKLMKNYMDLRSEDKKQIFYSAKIELMQCIFTEKIYKEVEKNNTSATNPAAFCVGSSVNCHLSNILNKASFLEFDGETITRIKNYINNRQNTIKNNREDLLKMFQLYVEISNILLKNCYLKIDEEKIKFTDLRESNHPSLNFLGLFINTSMRADAFFDTDITIRCIDSSQLYDETESWEPERVPYLEDAPEYLHTPPSSMEEEMPAVAPSPAAGGGATRGPAGGGATRGPAPIARGTPAPIARGTPGPAGGGATPARGNPLIYGSGPLRPGQIYSERELREMQGSSFRGGNRRTHKKVSKRKQMKKTRRNY